MLGTVEYTTKEFTIQEVIDAIAENGFDHLREAWIQTFSGKITGGCVLQQGALNLGVIAGNEEVPYEIENILPSEIGYGEHYPRIESTLVDALNKFPLGPDSKWKSHFGTTRKVLCGRAIITLNDEAKWVDIENGESTRQYLLPTYEAVVEMVKDILGPYANEVITLQTIDYSTIIQKKQAE